MDEPSHRQAATAVLTRVRSNESHSAPSARLGQGARVADVDERHAGGVAPARAASLAQMECRRPDNIADRYSDVLRQLPARYQKGIIALLSVGYYDGWRPTPDELAGMVSQRGNALACDDLALHRLRSGRNHRREEAPKEFDVQRSFDIVACPTNS